MPAQGYPLVEVLKQGRWLDPVGWQGIDRSLQPSEESRSCVGPEENLYK